MHLQRDFDTSWYGDGMGGGRIKLFWRILNLDTGRPKLIGAQE
jgi:hypothetical protein